MKIVSLLSRC